MNDSPRHNLTVVFLLALLIIGIAVALWFYLDKPSAVVSEEAVTETGIPNTEVPLEPDQEETIVEKSEEPASTGQAKRIVSVPDTDTRQVDILTVDQAKSQEDREIIEVMEAKVNAALAGDPLEGISAADFVNVCNEVAGKEYDWERRITAYRNVPRQSYSIEDGFGASRSTPSFDEWATILKDRIRKCRPGHSVFDQTTRERLRKEAEKGNRVARYLYAMWKPNPNTDNPDFVFERAEYEVLALEFTWRNVEEGELLGLLALGQSYQEGEFFTPQIIHVGSAYLMAAYSCGFKSDWLEKRIANFHDYTLEVAWENSERIKRKYCKGLSQLNTK